MHLPFVAPDYDIPGRRCRAISARLGSLAGGESFADLWYGAEWQRLRERLRSGGYFGGCARCGKYAQNVALGAAFERRYGPERLRAVTGRA